MKAMRIHTPGGIEALTYEDIPDPTPAPNEVVVRMEAAGVNFIDTYQRTGSYPLDPPFTLGMEGAYDAIGSGQVDKNWAREHHSVWAAEHDGTAPPDGGDDPGDAPQPAE